MKKSNRWLAYSILALVFSGLGGCSKSAEIPTTPTDASITDALRANLSSDSQLSGQRVDVTVSNGEVTLSGEVSTDAAHLQAYKLATETAGVKKVNDLLQVRPAAASAAPPEPPPAMASSRTPEGVFKALGSVCWHVTCAGSCASFTTCWCRFLVCGTLVCGTLLYAATSSSRAGGDDSRRNLGSSSDD